MLDQILDQFKKNKKKKLEKILEPDAFSDK